MHLVGFIIRIETIVSAANTVDAKISSELGYDITKGTENFPSLYKTVVVTE